jgi:hypothetical protein
MNSCYATILYLVTNGMTIQFDMFRAFMENRIDSNVQSSLIVAVKLGCLRMRDMKILKEISKPG